MKLVTVEWHDAWASTEGHTPEQIERDHGPTVQHSTGWLVKRDRRGVTIAGDRFVLQGELMYDRVLFVPARMVVKVRLATLR